MTSSAACRFAVRLLARWASQALVPIRPVFGGQTNPGGQDAKGEGNPGVQTWFKGFLRVPCDGKRQADGQAQRKGEPPGPRRWYVLWCPGHLASTPVRAR